jgi:hypothetical protein
MLHHGPSGRCFGKLEQISDGRTTDRPQASGARSSHQPSQRGNHEQVLWEVDRNPGGRVPAACDRDGACTGQSANLDERPEFGLDYDFQEIQEEKVYGHRIVGRPIGQRGILYHFEEEEQQEEIERHGGRRSIGQYGVFRFDREEE